MIFLSFKVNEVCWRCFEKRENAEEKYWESKKSKEFFTPFLTPKGIATALVHFHLTCSFQMHKNFSKLHLKELSFWDFENRIEIKDNKKRGIVRKFVPKNTKTKSIIRLRWITKGHFKKSKNLTFQTMERRLEWAGKNFRRRWLPRLLDQNLSQMSFCLIIHRAFLPEYRVFI